MRRRWRFGRWFSGGGVFFVTLLFGTVMLGVAAVALTDATSPLLPRVVTGLTCAVLGIATVIAFDRSMWGFRLDATCGGTVIETGVSCDESSTRWAKVRYRVGDIEYVRKVRLRLKTEKVVRVGGLPVGRRLAPGIGGLGPGDAVKVAYDSRHPERCDIVGNEGWTY